MINWFSLLEKKWFSISLKSAIKKYTAEEYQLLSLLLMNYSMSWDNKISWLMVIWELSWDSEVKMKTFKEAFLKLIEKENDILSIISEEKKDFEEEKKEREDYIIQSSDWKVQNKLFELLDRASQKMNFKFWKKYPLQTARNIKSVKQLLIKLENSVEPKTFDDIEYAYDKIYSIYIYDSSSISKSIIPFIRFCEEYFLLGEKENIELTIKWIYYYILSQGKKPTTQILWNAYQFFWKFALNIIFAIQDNSKLEKYQKLLKEFSDQYKRIWLNWTLKTLNEKIYSDKELSKRYLVEKWEAIINSLWTPHINKTLAISNYEKDFKDFMVKINETDPKMQSKLYDIYKKQWLDWLKELVS